LPEDHLARFIDEIVDESINPIHKDASPGQPEYDPRLCIKVLMYAYTTGVRSSRQMEKNCHENLAYLYLTRGDAPSYRVFCTARLNYSRLIEDVWVYLFAVADEIGLKRLGRIVIDSTKLRANASGEMVVKREEYADVKAELQRVLDEAEKADAKEDAEGYQGETRTGKKADKCQMRDIIRSVRERRSKKGKGVKLPTDGKVVTKKMKSRVSEAIAAIDEAESEGREHLCVTDPDARMMQGGTEKKVRESHSLEIAIDKDSGLIVAHDVTQSQSDNERLIPLVEAAGKNEPDGVKEVDGDSGYYKSGSISKLISDGIDTCIPDSTTACELHRGLPIGTRAGSGTVPLEYNEESDVYLCSEGNTLKFVGMSDARGEKVRRYQACQSCLDCKRRNKCIVSGRNKTRYKTIIIREHGDELQECRMRFNDPDHRHRYHQRGCIVESVFGIIKGALGYTRWLLRRRGAVNSEGKLIDFAYQLRTVHKQWAGVKA
jgi:transposase